MLFFQAWDISRTSYSGNRLIPVVCYSLQIGPQLAFEDGINTGSLLGQRKRPSEPNEEIVVDMIKFDDLRLDESALFLFAFKKGDIVTRKDDPSLRGEISDGVYIGKFPSPTAGSVSPRGKTLYEIMHADQSVSIVDETEIQKIESSDSSRD